MIKALEIEDFMGKSGRWSFGMRNVVTGPNETGKTTLARAIVFGLWGRDMSGAVFTDHLITQGKSACRVKVETARMTIERVNARAGTDLRVNNQPSKAQAFEAALVNTGLTFELFMSVFRPGYFMGELDERARRSLLLSLLPHLNREEILDRLTGVPGLGRKHGLDLRDLDAAAREVSKSFQSLEKERAHVRSVISGLESVASPKEIPAQEIEKLKSEHEAAEDLVRELEACAAWWTSYQEAKRDWERLASENAERRRQKEALELQVRMLEEGRCFTCRRKLPQRALGQDAARRENLLRECRDKLGGLDAIPMPSPPAEPGFSCPDEEEWRAARDRARRAKEELLRTEATNRAHNASDRRPRSEAEGASAKPQVGGEERLAEAREREQALTGTIMELEQLSDALRPTGIAQKELEANMGILREKAGSLEVLTEERLKSGQRRECLRVALNGIDYRLLSTGARRKADLMISRMLDRLSGGKVPVVFLDDADLLDCDVAFPPDRQVFICRVADEGELSVRTEPPPDGFGDDGRNRHGDRTSGVELAEAKAA